MNFGITILAAFAVGAEPPGDFAAAARPLVAKYCVGCHSTAAKKGSLDLERYATDEHVRKDIKPWIMAIEQVETHEMPPKGKPQPTDDERKKLVAWIRSFLDAEARAKSGDPGFIPLRRLSNAEYDYTIRDLTGVDLRPTREFPADGAAGEGFTNAAESLSDVSPALLTKYLNAAKDVSEHLVLLPDGVRFSPSKTRRDWTDEATAKLRAFFAPFADKDGRPPLAPYLAATIEHRDALMAGATTTDAVAEKAKLNAKYLGTLWRVLNDKAPSEPLDAIRAKWRAAVVKDVPALVAEVVAWQNVVTEPALIGSYRYGSTTRQVPKSPKAAASQRVTFSPETVPGRNDVTLFLAARDASSGGRVVWQKPRFEGDGETLLLRDYAKFGARYEIDFAAVFADTAKYLAAARDPAQSGGLDPALLKRWSDVLALGQGGFGQAVAPLELLDDPSQNDQKAWIRGWKKKGIDLPIVISNASDNVEQIPGRVAAHGVSVHPTPAEFVAVAWKSPIDGDVRVDASVAHAHPACGNGVAWRVEHRRGDRAVVLASGVLDLGKGVKPAPMTLAVAKGDRVVLAVDARDANHICDLTEVALSVTESAKPNRNWDVAKDAADTIGTGNPHGVWSFVRGPSKADAKGPLVPPTSVLGRWRDAKGDTAIALAAEVQKLLTGPRPADVNAPDGKLYDLLVSADGPLFAGLDATKLPKPKGVAFGLPAASFDADGNLVAASDSVTEVRLPAALFADLVFVADGKIADGSDRVVRFEVAASPPTAAGRWDGKSPVVAAPAGEAYKQFQRGYDAFRETFPVFVCFPAVIPTDEVVCLKMFHREDEALARLMLSDEQKRHLDYLWAEHRFISQQPVAENDYLPQFIGFVTQDQPKELLAYFEGQRPAFRERAEKFEQDAEAAVPNQMIAVLEFASRAFRRPLADKEKQALIGLFGTLRKKGASRDEAFRGVVARVLVSPAFLFRVEQPPAGEKAGPVSDWELATRLSYFLWSSVPDDELRKLAAEGKLRDPAVLAAQAKRMTADPRQRAMAVEFGTQWLHVRGFDSFDEKNEKLFPTFDAKLRAAINEESVLFFRELFQGDRPVSDILAADYTFLNETLAKHYGIPGVAGEQWRKVEGVRKYGRGGILGLASVQAKESGASRTSPVLRGNWVVETLLGEKLPRPPANVPRLPESEAGNDGLTMRQLVERHTKDANCATCHQRIDPFGFAFERFDSIGRRREKDLGGLPVDAKATLKDGTTFEDIDGLRDYLLAKKKDVIERLFCKRLLGYALGRAVTLSDSSLLDEMVAGLAKNDGRVSAAVLAIVRSPQFREVRGAGAGE